MDLRLLRSGFVILASCAVLAAQGPKDDGNFGRVEPVPKTVREASERALDYVLRAQNRDGSWGDNPGSQGEIGNTCIATLALIAHGSTLSRGPWHRNVRRAIDWVRIRTRDFRPGMRLDNETLLQRKLGENADLYLVALLYSQALGLNLDVPDEDVMRKELSAMCASIASLQKSNGEWETSYEPMLTTICAWLALRQAHTAGIGVGQASPQKVVDYLRKECLDSKTGTFKEAKWGRQERFVTQAGGVRVLNSMGEGNQEDGRKAMQVLHRMRFDQDVGGSTGGEEFLGALFATQAMYIESAADHAKWYAKITKALMASQNKDGSWMGHHCITGRVFCTSCSIIAMLVPDRLMPMGER